MKKLVIGLVALAVLLVCGIGYHEYSKCRVPSEEVKELAFQICFTQFLNDEGLRTRACQNLKGEHECEFTPADADDIDRFIRDELNACMDKTLAEENFCTDTYDRL